MSWTDEKVAKLVELWEEGHSASNIGKELGVSKNAVVGKAHRLKLKSRPSPIKKSEDLKSSDKADSKKPKQKKTKDSQEAVSKEGEIKGVEPIKAEGAVQKKVTAKDHQQDKVQQSPELNDKTPSSSQGEKPVSKQLPPAKPTKTKRRTSNGDPFAKDLFAAFKESNPARPSKSCLWPIGDPTHPDFKFCDKRAIEGKPYCDEHCSIAYVTKSKSDEAA